MKLHSLKFLLSSLSIATLVLASGLAQSSTSKVYYLKGAPQTGSNIPSIIASSEIPFNKSYKNLSDEQQSIFKKKFDDLNVNDTPPFPKRGLKKIYRPIVKANKYINAQGSLQLMANVNANGFVESVKVISSPSEKLSAAAEKVLLSTKFDPASCDGTACEMAFPFEISFK